MANGNESHHQNETITVTRYEPLAIDERTDLDAIIRITPPKGAIGVGGVAPQERSVNIHPLVTSDVAYSDQGKSSALSYGFAGQTSALGLTYSESELNIDSRIRPTATLGDAAEWGVNELLDKERPRLNALLDTPVSWNEFNVGAEAINSLNLDQINIDMRDFLSTNIRYPALAGGDAFDGTLAQLAAAHNIDIPDINSSVDELNQFLDSTLIIEGRDTTVRALLGGVELPENITFSNNLKNDLSKIGYIEGDLRVTSSNLNREAFTIDAMKLLEFRGDRSYGVAGGRGEVTIGRITGDVSYAGPINVVLNAQEARELSTEIAGQTISVETPELPEQRIPVTYLSGTEYVDTLTGKVSVGAFGSYNRDLPVIPLRAGATIAYDNTLAGEEPGAQMTYAATLQPRGGEYVYGLNERINTPSPWALTGFYRDNNIERPFEQRGIPMQGESFGAQINMRLKQDQAVGFVDGFIAVQKEEVRFADAAGADRYLVEEIGPEGLAYDGDTSGLPNDLLGGDSVRVGIRIIR